MEGKIRATLFLSFIFVSSRADENILKAVEKGDVAKITSLLAQGPGSCSGQDHQGQNVLHLAALFPDAAILDLLMNHANCSKSIPDLINAKDHDGVTPVYPAIYAGNAAGVNLLLSRGADVLARTSGEGETPLHFAASYPTDNADIVDLLITREGAPVEAVIEKTGETALHLSVSARNFKIIRSLIKDHGANPNAKDKLGRTPLHLAVLANNLEMTMLILDLVEPESVNVKDDFGRTALHHAAMVGSIPVANGLLAKAGPGLKLIRDLDGATPAEIALMTGRYNEVLFKKLASPEATEAADLQKMLNGGQNHLTNAGSLIQAYVDHVLGLGNYTDLLDETVTALGNEVGWRTNLTLYDNHLHQAKANARLWHLDAVPKLKETFIQTRTFGVNFMELYDLAKTKYPELQDDLSSSMTPAQKEDAVNRMVAEERKRFSELGVPDSVLVDVMKNYRKKVSDELEAHLRDPDGMEEVRNVIEFVLDQALLAKDKAAWAAAGLQAFRETVIRDKDQFSLDKKELIENTEVQAKSLLNANLKNLKKAIEDKGVSTKSVEKLGLALTKSLEKMKTLNNAGLGLQGVSLFATIVPPGAQWAADRYSSFIAKKVDCTGTCEGFRKHVTRAKEDYKKYKSIKKTQTKEKYQFMKETDTKLQELKADKSGKGKAAYKARKIELKKAAKAETNRKLRRVRGRYKSVNFRFKKAFPKAEAAFRRASKLGKAGKYLGYVKVGLQIFSLVTDIIMQDQLKSTMWTMEKTQADLEKAYQELAIHSQSIHNINLVVMRISMTAETRNTVVARLNLLIDMATAAITELDILTNLLDDQIVNLKLMHDQAKLGEKSLDPGERQVHFDSIRLILKNMANNWRGVSVPQFQIKLVLSDQDLDEELDINDNLKMEQNKSN